MNVEWNNLCRLCARFDMSGVRIFERLDLQLQDKISKYLAITVELKDQLPKLICQTCTNQLVSFDQYADQCLQVQIRFGAMLDDQVNTMMVKECPKDEDDVEENEENSDDDQEKEDTEGSITSNIGVPVFIKQEVLDDEQPVDIKVFQEEETHSEKYFSKTLIGAVKAKVPKLVHHLIAKAFSNGCGEESEQHLQVRADENEYSSDDDGDGDDEEDDFYPFKCDTCGKPFNRKQLLDVHRLSHVPSHERPFPCSKCNRRFNSDTRLRRHEETHIPRKERSVNCPLCNETSTNSHALRKHMQTEHSDQPRYKCELCGLFFKTKYSLEKHEIVHNGLFRCAHCNKSFKTKPTLKVHIDTHNETPYQCPNCPLQLSTKRTLRNHLVVHSNVKAYLCATCGKPFKRLKGLKNHQTQHTGLHPYTCMFCYRTFASGPNCRAHKRKMHGEELRKYEASLAAAQELQSQTIQSSDSTVSVLSTSLTEDHDRILFVTPNLTE